MIRNSLKIALRNFYKKPAFSIINVLGLAIGLACFVLTMVYINYELSHDAHHEKSDRIYLVTATLNFADYYLENQESTTATLAETLKRTYPEVETATQTVFGYSNYVRRDEIYFREHRITFADSSFFNVFTHEFLIGDPEKALTEPYSVILTESTAKKYFGDENAYGETLHLIDKNYKVTGVVKDNPGVASFGFDILVSVYQWEGYYNDPQWQNNNWLNFLVLKEGADPDELDAKFPDLLASKIQTIKGQNFNDWLADGNRWEYHLYLLKDVYLDLWGNGIYLVGFGIVAVFLLVIACINFMNLSTAKSAQRAKEVGVRKSFGGYRSTLIKQFLSESIFMSFLSLIIGMGMLVGLYSSFLPFFENVGDIVEYNSAYYGAVSSVERGLLVSKYQQPGFE